MNNQNVNENKGKENTKPFNELTLEEKKRKKERLVDNLKIAGGVIAGAAAGGMVVGFQNDLFGANPDVKNEVASENPDTLSLEDKFANARLEGGPYGTFEHEGQTYHTFTEEEYKALSSEQKQALYENVQGKDDNIESEVKVDFETDNFEPVIYGTAPITDSVTDDMSFSEAFKTARNEVGSGGVFEWHGQLFNTYYAEEFNQMTSDEKSEYVASIDIQNIAPDVADVEIGGDVMPAATNSDDLDMPTGTIADEAPNYETNDVSIPTGTLTDEEISVQEPQITDNGEIDFDGDGITDGRILSVEDSNNDGNPEAMYMDVNNDGVADMKIVDTNQDGNPDEIQIDQDGDGIFDARMIDTDNDGTPDDVVQL